MRQHGRADNAESERGVSDRARGVSISQARMYKMIPAIKATWNTCSVTRSANILHDANSNPRPAQNDSSQTRKAPNVSKSRSGASWNITPSYLDRTIMHMTAKIYKNKNWASSRFSYALWWIWHVGEALKKADISNKHTTRNVWDTPKMQMKFILTFHEHLNALVH